MFELKEDRIHNLTGSLTFNVLCCLVSVNKLADSLHLPHLIEPWNFRVGRCSKALCSLESLVLLHSGSIALCALFDLGC